MTSYSAMGCPRMSWGGVVLIFSRPPSQTRSCLKLTPGRASGESRKPRFEGWRRSRGLPRLIFGPPNNLHQDLSGLVRAEKNQVTPECDLAGFEPDPDARRLQRSFSRMVDSRVIPEEAHVGHVAPGRHSCRNRLHDPKSSNACEPVQCGRPGAASRGVRPPSCCAGNLVEWACPACGAFGIITGWEASRWDLQDAWTQPPVRGHTPSHEVELSDDEYTALRSCTELMREHRVTVVRAIFRDGRIVLSGSSGEARSEAREVVPRPEEGPRASPCA